MIPFTGGIKVVFSAQVSGWAVYWGGCEIKSPCDKAAALRYVREQLKAKRIDP